MFNTVRLCQYLCNQALAGTGIGGSALILLGGLEAWLRRCGMSLAPLLVQAGSAVMWFVGLLCRCKKESNQSQSKYPQLTAL